MMHSVCISSAVPKSMQFSTPLGPSLQAHNHRKYKGLVKEAASRGAQTNLHTAAGSPQLWCRSASGGCWHCGTALKDRTASKQTRETPTFTLGGITGI